MADLLAVTQLALPLLAVAGLIQTIRAVHAAHDARKAARR